MDIAPCGLKGDHYGSIMFRIKVEYQLNDEADLIKTSLVLKTLPEVEGFKREILMESAFFETEISMYAETLPLVEEILEKHGDHTKFGPRYILLS